MNLLIVSGSQRKSSQSAKVANYIHLNSHQFSNVEHLELCQHQLPFWDGDEDSQSLKESDWPNMNAQIKQSDALVLITPEWGGMATPILKNFLLLCDQQNTGHKPALIVSVVNGISGAYPISEIRMNSLKNNKLVAVPDHLIIRNVEEVLNQNSMTQLSPREVRLRNRIKYSLHMLHQYSQALKPIRDNHLERAFPQQQEYQYGM